MSISQLLQPNSYNIYASKLNDISGQEISVSNETGQVLTIVDKVNKTVAFRNILPSTNGEPDGYVLGIKNNLNGELEWKQDAQGSIPDPLVLSGTASVNKFQVRDSGNASLFTVDTVNSQILLNEQTLVQGIDDTVKFGVYNDADNTPEFVVDTVNHQIKIGSIDSTEKFNIKDGGGNNVFNVDSVNHGCNIVNNAGNKNITMTTQGITGPDIIVDSSNVLDAFSRVQVKNSSVDGGSISILAFPSGNGTSITCNGPLSMNSYQLTLTGETLIRTSNPKENHFVCEDVGGVDYFKVNSLNGIVTSSLKTEISGNAAKGKFTVKNSISDPIITVNTDGDVGTVLIANGSNDENKFVVRNVAQTDIIRIDTTNDRIESRGKFLLNGSNNNYKLLIKNNNSNDVFRVDTIAGSAYFGDSNGTNVTLIEPNIAKQIIYGSGTNAPTLLLKNLTQTSELSLVATGNGQPNKLISNKPLSISAQGDTLITTSIGSLELNASTSSSMYANNGNINMIVSDGTVFPQFTVKNDSSVLLIEDSFFPALNHMELRYNRIVSKGSPLNTNQSYINFNPNSKTISMSPRELFNITSYYNEIPGNGTAPSVVSPMVQVIWTQPVWTNAVFINGSPLNFTAPTAGSVQYTGSETSWFTITLSVCSESSDPDQEVQLVMLDNSNVIIPNTYNCFYTSTINKSGGICCSFQRQLIQNDIIKFAFRTPRQATNMTFMGYRIQVIQC